MAMAESLPDNLDKSLSSLISELNENEFSDQLLLDNQAKFNKAQSYYLIYQSRIEGQLEKLKAAGLSAKYARLEDYKDDFESDVGTIISALSSYYAQNLNNDEGVISSLLSEVKQVVSYYWSRFNVGRYYDSLENRFVPVLHSNSFPTEAVKNYSVDLNLNLDLLPHVAGSIEIDSTELRHYDIDVMNKAKDLDFKPIEIYNYVNQLPSELYWGQKKSLSATLLSGGNAVDKARLLSELLLASGFNAHVVDGVANINADNIQSFLGLKKIDDIIESLTQAGQSFSVEKLNGVLKAIKIRHVWVDAELPFKNYRGHGVENDARSWVSLDAFYSSINYNKLTSEVVVQADAIEAYQKNAVINGVINSPVSEVFIEEIEQLNNAESNKLAYLPASMPFEVQGYYRKGNQVLTDLQQLVNFTLVKPGFFESELFNVDIPISDLYAKSVVLTFIPATVEDQALATVFGGVDMVPAYLMNLLPVLEVDGKRYVAGQKPLSMANVLQLNIQYQKPYIKTISKDVLAGGYYAIAFNDSINSYQQDDSIGLGSSMLNESAQLYLEHWFKSEQIIEKNMGIKYHYPVPSIAIMANANRVSYFDEQAVALEWKGVELDAIFHAANISVLDQAVSHYNDQETELTPSQIRSFKQSLITATNRLTGIEASWYESEIIKNYFNVDAISADALIAKAISNGSSILTESTLTDSEIQAFPQYIQQQLNWAITNGYELHITQEKQTVNDWQGYAWIITNPQTGQGGYYLSGAIAGGSSTDSSDVIWQLLDPKESAPSSGLGAFSYLKILSKHDEIKTANDITDLEVEARGHLNEVVSGVPIKFFISLGNGTVNDTKVVTVITDESGKATVSLRHGPEIKDGLFYDDGGKYLQKYGLVTVSILVGGLAQDIVSSYFKPAIGTIKVKSDITGEGSRLTDISYKIWAEDAFGNSVANVPFQVNADRYTPEFGDEPFILLFGADVDVQSGTLNSSTTLRTRHVSFDHNRYPGPARLTVKNESGAVVQENNFTFNNGDDPYYNPWYVEQAHSGDILGHPDYYFDPVSGLDIIKESGVSKLCNDQSNMLIENLVADRLIIPTERTTTIASFPSSDICRTYLAIASSHFYYFSEKLEGVAATYQANSDHTSMYVNDVLYHAGSEPGTVQVAVSTKAIPSVLYDSDKFTLDITIVKGVIESPNLALGVYSNNLFKLSQPYIISHTLLPDESIQLTYGVTLNLYKDGVLADQYQSESGPSTGIMSLPIGYEFDTASKYEVEAEFGDSSIRSEKIPVIFPLIRAHSRKIQFNKYVDVSNSLSCTMGSSIGYIETSYDTQVSVKATELFVQDNLSGSSSAVKMIGDTVELLSALSVPAGVSTKLPIYTTLISPGSYQLTITAENSELGLSETVTSILKYKLEFEDTLPVAHTLYQGVDLADASLNLSRQDAVLPGNTAASSLDISRRYNSKNAKEGSIGAGWSDSNLVTLYERPCGYVIANGIRFIESSGSYTPAKGYHGSLEKYGDSFVLTTVGGTQYYFEEHNEGVHKVLNVKYADGYNVKYAYQNDTDEIRLSRMDDNFDRFVEYQYSDFERVSGSSEIMTRVTSVNVNDFKTIYYDYDGYARLKDVYIKTDGFSKELIEHYTYSAAISVDEAQHETYKEQNEYPSIEYPSFFDDYVLGTNQQTQRLPLLLSVTDALGQETAYKYKPQKLNKLEAIDPNLVSYGHPTLIQITNKNGNLTEFNYQFADDSEGSATITRPIGNIFYQLDNYGSAKKMTDDAGTELFVFNDDHLLEKHTDKNGHTTTYQYDEQGNKTSEEIAGTTVEYKFGGIQTLAGQANNALLGKTLGNTVVAYGYNGNCTTPESQSFPEVKRIFDENCQVVTELDGEGNTKTFSYDDKSRLIKVTKKGINGERFNKTINWSKTYTKSSETDFNGHTTRYAYNHLGQVIKQINPKGDDHIFVRDKLGQVTSETDFIGRTKTYEYDAIGNQTQVSYQGHTKTFEYDVNNNRTSATDWLGRQVTYTYNTVNQLTQERHPLGKTIDYGRDSNGNVLSQSINVNGVAQTTLREYDEQNRLVKETDAENNIQLLEYDASNNVNSKTNKNGVVTSYKHDTNGQPIEMTTGNRTWKYEYNVVGQKTSETDPIAGVTNYRYDGSGNLISQQKTGSGTWTFQFDGEGNKLLEVNPLGDTSSYSYNKINGLIKKEDALDQAWTFNLDGLNKVLSEQRPNGASITYGYDDFDQQVSYTDSIGQLWLRTFDAVGNLLSETNGNGQATSHTYNALNQLTKTQLPNNAVYSFTYDELGQKRSETDANNHTTTYEYDKVGNLEKQTNPFNHSIVSTYDSEGNPLTMTDGRANTTHYQYNDFNERIKTTNALNHVITLTYDDLGRVLTEVDAKGYKTENT
jgi:YD repeat-containing protein